MSVSNLPVPAGWYPDPAGSFQQRWWTGTSWTNDFAQYRPTLIHSTPVAEQIQTHGVLAQSETASQAAGASQVARHVGVAAIGGRLQTDTQTSTQTLVREPIAPTTPDPLPVFRLPDADQPPQTMVAQPNAGNAELIPVAQVTPRYNMSPDNSTFSSVYLPFAATPEIRRGVRTRPQQRYTVAVWFLALLPIFIVASAYAVAFFLPQLYTVVAQLILGALVLVIGLLLAVADRRALYYAGHDRTAHPALALLSPVVYLIVRAVTVSRETRKAAAWPLIILVIVIGGISAAMVLVEGVLPLVVGTNGLF